VIGAHADRRFAASAWMRAVAPRCARGMQVRSCLGVSSRVRARRRSVRCHGCASVDRTGRDTPAGADSGGRPRRSARRCSIAWL
jgi:hypothetical protein